MKKPPEILLLLLLLLPTFSHPVIDQSQLVPYTFHYLHLHDLFAHIQDLKSKQCPSIIETFTIGKSVLGRDIFGVRLSKGLSSNVHVRKPKVKYVANMHGDETVGYTILINFIEHLCYLEGKDSDVDEILEKIDLYIIPSLNPDGLEKSLGGVDARENQNGIDLNRNFPDPWVSSRQPIQPETRAMMDWLNSTHFVLSGNFHGGALVANFPWDGRPPSNSPNPPDLELFEYLARIYSKNHPEMSGGKNCGDSFQDGITQGYKWYPLSGGMQDYNYIKSQTVELTIEVSCHKHPPENQLESFWKSNRLSLIKYTKAGRHGVSGRILDGTGQPLVGAVVKVDSISSEVYTDQNGEFWRLLVPGKVYTVTISHNGNTILQKDVDLTARESVDLDFVQPTKAPQSSVSLQWEFHTTASYVTIFVLIGIIFLFVARFVKKRKS